MWKAFALQAMEIYSVTDREKVERMKWAFYKMNNLFASKVVTHFAWSIRSRNTDNSQDQESRN